MKINLFRTLHPFIVFFLLLLTIPCLVTASGSPPLPSSTKIINMVDNFLHYYERSKSVSEDERLKNWDTLLESKHTDFFQQVIYRNKSGSDREQYKKYCIHHFWDEVVWRLPKIRKLNEIIEKKIREVQSEFLKQFPDSKLITDFYVTISFSFRGKVVELNRSDIFAIGLENFEPGDPQLQITIAHELFHLYHFQFFSTSGGLYRTLWAEGLAVYASSMIVPGYRFSKYLGFSGEKMNHCKELLPFLTQELRKNMGKDDYRLKRIYFGAEPNDTQIPPEAGYYVGLMVVDALAQNYSLNELIKMEVVEIYKIMEQELLRISKTP